MAYQSFWFEPSTPLFPTQEVVLDYIRRYAEHFDLRRYYRFNSVVEEALWKENSWHIRISSIGTRQFQKVIVCNGHYREPRYPKIPGLEEWIKLGRASHSVYFRNERRYARKTVLVIGNGPSGQDISTEIAPVAKAIYHSVTGGTPQDVGVIRR
ncbi:MAG TPA: NAD(P)-binding domain-containing protein, partial [Chlamydiales bacterium]|nr:NAD(P)-binding domain-containing protein [Chlamydiales bacterium]